MTSRLRLRAAAVLSAAAVVTGALAAAAPAQATGAMYSPCTKYYTAYQQDSQKSAAYYTIYKQSTGAARTKAYQEYVDYRTEAQQNLKHYDTCVHGG